MLYKALFPHQPLVVSIRFPFGTPAWRFLSSHTCPRRLNVEKNIFAHLDSKFHGYSSTRRHQVGSLETLKMGGVYWPDHRSPGALGGSEGLRNEPAQGQSTGTWYTWVPQGPGACTLNHSPEDCFPLSQTQQASAWMLYRQMACKECFGALTGNKRPFCSPENLRFNLPFWAVEKNTHVTPLLFVSSIKEEYLVYSSFSLQVIDCL